MTFVYVFCASHTQGVRSPSNGVHANGMRLRREMYVQDDLFQIINRVVVLGCFFRHVTIVSDAWRAVEEFTVVVFGFRRHLTLLTAALAGFDLSAYSCIGGPNCSVQVGAQIDGGCVSSGFGICFSIGNVGAFDG